MPIGGPLRGVTTGPSIVTERWPTCRIRSAGPPL